MPTKKKPAKSEGPKPLLKLTFPKFPSRPVSVYFETAKLCFYADFGFEQYESPSVAGLKQKIEAAIKKGATPEPVWVPMMKLGIHIGHGRRQYKETLDLDFDVDIERRYFCIGRGGKLMCCDWDTPERSRAKNTHELYGTLGDLRPRLLNAPIFKRGSNWDGGGSGVHALVPYTAELWKDLGEQIQHLRAQAAGMIGAVAAGKIDVFANFIFDFEHAAKAATSKPKPAKKPAPPVSNKIDNHQPERQLGGSAKKGLGKSLDSIREDVKNGSAATPKKKRSNGDHTAREHLVVKYQGKELTLGHGPLGNYLVEALRKHYPEIHSAFCLKDNQIQISITGGDTFTISGAEFENKINHAPPPLPKHGAPIMPEVANSIRKGAIERLHELAKEFEAHDSLTLPGNNFKVIDIPSVILLAAGFPKNAIAEMQQTVISGQNRAEIILRLPKKSPQFLTVNQLEQKILEQVRAAEAKPQEELVHA